MFPWEVQSPLSQLLMWEMTGHLISPWWPDDAIASSWLRMCGHAQAVVPLPVLNYGCVETHFTASSLLRIYGHAFHYLFLAEDVGSCAGWCPTASSWLRMCGDAQAGVPLPAGAVPLPRQGHSGARGAAGRACWCHARALGAGALRRRRPPRQRLLAPGLGACSKDRSLCRVQPIVCSVTLHPENVHRWKEDCTPLCSFGMSLRCSARPVMAVRLVNGYSPQDWVRAQRTGPFSAVVQGPT